MGTDRVRTAEPWHLLRNVILLLLVVLAVSLGLVVLQKRGNPAPLLLFNFLADASIGLVMGLGSRAVFRRRPWPIKALVSGALSIVGLVFLGGITQNQSGIGPLRVDLASVDWLAPVGITLQLPTMPRQNETDPIDAAHLLIAMDVSWLALRAWARTGGGRSAMRSRMSSAPARIVANPVSAPIMRSSNPPGAPAVRSTAHVRSRPMVRPRRFGPVIAVSGSRRGGAAGGRRRGVLNRRATVQIAAYEEHRCPYCLQDIKREDVRGSVECPICHTLHHKDCWDITGTCQVPHLNG